MEVKGVQIKNYNILNRNNDIIAFEENNQSYILTAPFDKTAKIWNLNGQCIKTLNEGIGNNIRSVATFKEKNQTYIVTAILNRENNSVVRIWNFKTGKCIGQLGPIRPFNVTSIKTFKENNQTYIAIGLATGTTIIWNFEIRKTVKKTRRTYRMGYFSCYI